MVPDIRRVTVEGFFSSLWRLPVFWRRILPCPSPSPACSCLSGSSSSAWWPLLRLVGQPPGVEGCVGAASVVLGSDLGIDVGVEVLRTPTSPASARPWRRRTARCARRARGLRSASRSAALRSRSAATSTFASDFFLCGPSTMIMLRPSCLGADSTKPSSSTSPARPLQQPEPELGAVLLAATEHDRDLDLVARLQEPHDVTLLGLVVVRVDLRAKLHLLDDRVGLVAPRLACLLGVLVLELPVVHELADRRAGRRRHLDQVEV